jgi:hypothetical protein
MTTMIHPATSNDRKRPSLDEQINRLDNMLDGLSEGLNEAVAEAVKVGVGTAVKEAVQAVLTEVLTHPEMRARLFPEATPTAKVVGEPAAQLPNSWWQRVRACIGYLRRACESLLDAAGNAIAHAWQSAWVHCAAVWANCGMLWPFRFQILLALGIGVAVGIGVCHAEPWIAALTSGVGGFVTTLTVQAGLWLRKVLASDSREFA